jgi:superfamily II DNA or RNA helicase
MWCRSTGRLRPDPKRAAAVAGEDRGVLCAATAFDKTGVAAAVIARRGVNIVILVHRADLLH